MVQHNLLGELSGHSRHFVEGNDVHTNTIFLNNFLRYVPYVYNIYYLPRYLCIYIYMLPTYICIYTVPTLPYILQFTIRTDVTPLGSLCKAQRAVNYFVHGLK